MLWIHQHTDFLRLTVQQFAIMSDKNNANQVIPNYYTLHISSSLNFSVNNPTVNSCFFSVNFSIESNIDFVLFSRNFHFLL